MNTKEKPIGKVKPVAFQERQVANDLAVFVDIICEDEAGKRWAFPASSFCFDMKPYKGREIND